MVARHRHHLSVWAKHVIALVLLVVCVPVTWDGWQRASRLHQQLATLTVRNKGFADVGQRLSTRYAGGERSDIGPRRLRLQREYNTWLMIVLFSGGVAVGATVVLIRPVARSYVEWFRDRR
jgi:hypothetical protein